MRGARAERLDAGMVATAECEKMMMEWTMVATMDL